MKFVIPSVAMYAQTEVSGTVVDDKGEPVIGAAVLVNNNPQLGGAITDQTGRFSIEAPVGSTLFFTSMGYDLTRQNSNIVINGISHEITYVCPSLKELPVIVIGDKTGDADIDTLDKCSLDYRAKGAQRKKSPHATMLEYLNNCLSETLKVFCRNVYLLLSFSSTPHLKTY